MSHAREPSKDPLALVDFRPPRGWMRWIALLAACASWYISLDLVRLHYQRSATIPLLQSQCGQQDGAGGTFDCQAVLQSQWSVVRIGKTANGPVVPVALFGMAYFACVGVWFLFIGAPTRTRWSWHLVLLFVVACGVIQSLQLIHVMQNILHKWCIGCLVAHGCNGVIALMTILAFPWRQDEPAQVPHPAGRLGFATLLCAFLIGAVHLMAALVTYSGFYASKASAAYTQITEDPAFVRWQYERQPVWPELLSASTDRDGFGDSEAPHTAVVFFDPQCTKCGTAIHVVEKLIAEHPGVLRLDIRHFPMDGACNQGMPTSTYAGSCEAATALVAARRLGGVDALMRMKAIVAQGRAPLSTAPYADWAAEAGLERAAFERALESPATEAELQADITLGKRLGVKATPVVFLDGRQLDHWQRPDGWKPLLGVSDDFGASAPASQPADAD